MKVRMSKNIRFVISSFYRLWRASHNSGRIKIEFFLFRRYLYHNFLTIAQELTENDDFDGGENGEWGWVKNSFCDPIVLLSPQGVTQILKGQNWIPLVQEIFVPPIFLRIAQEFIKNDAFKGGRHRGVENWWGVGEVAGIFFGTL